MPNTVVNKSYLFLFFGVTVAPLVLEPNSPMLNKNLSTTQYSIHTNWVQTLELVL